MSAAIVPFFALSAMFESASIDWAQVVSGKSLFAIGYLALIGVWLIVHTLADKGPLVTITFRTAEGIEIGKTRIKYKDVDVGQISAVALADAEVLQTFLSRP